MCICKTAIRENNPEKQRAQWIIYYVILYQPITCTTTINMFVMITHLLAYHYVSTIQMTNRLLNWILDSWYVCEKTADKACWYKI